MPCSLSLLTVWRMSSVASAMCCTPGPPIELEILLDLRLLFAFGWLVDGELDVAVAVGHHLRHERRVFGGDVLVVEVLVEREAHDVGVELDPLVHLVPAHVADHVVDVEQAGGAGDRVALDGAVAGKECAGVVLALDKGVNRVAVGADAGHDDLPALIGEDVRLRRR